MDLALRTMQGPTRWSPLQGIRGSIISAKIPGQLLHELLCLVLVKEPVAGYEFLEHEYSFVHADLPRGSFLAGLSQSDCEAISRINRHASSSYRYHIMVTKGIEKFNATSRQSMII